MQQDLYDLCSVMPSDLEHLDEVLTSLTCFPQSLLQDPCQLSTMSALTNQLPLLVDQFFCTSSCSLQQVLPHCLILKLPPMPSEKSPDVFFLSHFRKPLPKIDSSTPGVNELDLKIQETRMMEKV